ncbi:MAG TPA: helix-turn-helix domain-containing protein [Jatrophihabitans sp.]|nr:helix-turn-helix domain-containing protein [Jatrophihabitans sp.]
MLPPRVCTATNALTRLKPGNIAPVTANSHNPGGLVQPSLRPVGIDEIEEGIYRALVRGPRATLTELASVVGHTVVVTRRALDGLEAAGLVSRQGKPSRFIPAAPDMAVEALIMRRQEELERCRIAAADLLTQYRQASRGAADVVELITGREASLQRYVQLLTTARTEVLMFDKPPYLGPVDNPLEMEVLARGVSWRAIYAPEALDQPDRLFQLHAWQAAGEQARIYNNVPLKLALVDRREALLPLTADSQGAENTAILVHPSSLLATLGLLFDMLWDQSLPLSAGAPDADAPAGGLPDIDRALLQLLTAGVKDQAIARQLGVSLRTVRRRLANLMSESGVASRFQLGVLAAHRGWI